MINDSCFRMLLVLNISKQIDIEAEFLEGKLEEELYVRLPEGMECIMNKTDNYGRLNRSIYGLVQESHQFFVELKTYLKINGFD